LKKKIIKRREGKNRIGIKLIPDTVSLPEKPLSQNGMQNFHIHELSYVCLVGQIWLAVKKELEIRISHVRRILELQTSYLW
jgi:hypothetical protein